MIPGVGDAFWIRSEGRLYIGKIVGRTPGGRKLICEFQTEIPKISGRRRQRVNVAPAELTPHKMFNVPWELRPGEGTSRSDRELGEPAQEDMLFEEVV